MLKNTLITLLAGFLAASASFFIYVPSAVGQTSGSGALAGTLTDASGAVLPNATVTVTSTETGQTRTVTTAPDGSYKVALLPPGNYRVKFEAAGFQSVEIPSARVTVTETGTLNQTLAVGSQAQQVTIQANVETVQTTNAALGSVLSGPIVTDLPLTTRNYQNLIGMSAGANASVPNATALGKATSITAVNGSSTAQNNFQMDGVSVNNWLSFSTGAESGSGFYGAQGIPNPDSIAEFKIQTSTYDAGYGRNPGANVDVVTKSGTNNFHGAAFEFFRNTVLNANDFFRNLTLQPRGVLNQNQYGGVFGGPVKKDKLFFFVSYQETVQKNGIAAAGSSTVHLPPIPPGNRGTCPVNWTVLTQCDAAAQAFVPALGAAICPTNNPTNTFDKVTIPNSIPVACDGSNINPVAVNILQLKLPNGNYYAPGSGVSPSLPYPLQTYSDPARYQEHQGMGNWDYIINSKHTLSGRYFYGTDPSLFSFPGGNSPPGLTHSSAYTNHSALLKLTSLLSNNLVNELRVSYQRNVSLLTTPTANNFTDTQVGITPLATAIPELSLIGIGGVFTLGNNGFSVYYQSANQYQWGDQISWTHGKQTIRVGFEFERIQAYNVVGGLAVGSPTLGSFPDFLIGRAACPAGTFGNGPGQCNVNNPGNSNGTSALSNITSVGTTTTNAVGRGGLWPHYYRVPDLYAFVQDDFKVNSRLTVNVGVRWEYDGLPHDALGSFSSIWPSIMAIGPIPGNSPATGTLIGFVVPSNYSSYSGPPPPGVLVNGHNIPSRNNVSLDNFAPRVGFAWQPLANGRLVLRAGGGYFYDRASGSTTQVLYNAQPFEVSPTPSPTLTLANPFVIPPTIPAAPGTIGFTPRWINFANNTNSGISNATMAELWQTPVVYQWNINSQYEFLRGWVFELGYVGSHGIHQAGTTSYNPAPLASPSNPLHCGYDGVPTDCIITSTAANIPTRVPYLGLSSQVTSSGTTLSYKYNSLQATVRKQLSHGLQLAGAYTWSRAFVSQPLGMPDLSTGTSVCCFGPQFIYGLNPSYRPHRFILSYSYTLPFGHPHGIAGKLVEGWRLSGVTTIQNGSPLNITDSRGGVAYGFTSSGAQYCSGMGAQNIPTSGSLVSRVTNGYMNKTGVFCAPPPHQQAVGDDTSTGFGNVGLGPILGPGQNNWDISVNKITTVGGIREGATLEFRAEFFNAFNHAQFSNPVTNVNSATFGTISGSSVNPRLIQFALKYAF